MNQPVNRAFASIAILAFVVSGELLCAAPGKGLLAIAVVLVGAMGAVFYARNENDSHGFYDALRVVLNDCRIMRRHLKNGDLPGAIRQLGWANFHLSSAADNERLNRSAYRRVSGAVDAMQEQLILEIKLSR